MFLYLIIAVLLYLIFMAAIALAMYAFSSAFFEKKTAYYWHYLIVLQYAVYSLIFELSGLWEANPYGSVDEKRTFVIFLLTLPLLVFIYRKKGFQYWQAFILFLVFVVFYVLVTLGGWNPALLLLGTSPW
jgi:hypothetical protein